MSKVVTAIAAIFVIGVLAVLAINHGALDMILGEGEADAAYEIENNLPTDITVTFDDGINEPRTVAIPNGTSVTLEGFHYAWDNKAPRTLTAHCTFQYMSLGFDVQKTVTMLSGSTETFVIDISPTSIAGGLPLP